MCRQQVMGSDGIRNRETSRRLEPGAPDRSIIGALIHQRVVDGKDVEAKALKVSVRT